MSAQNSKPTGLLGALGGLLGLGALAGVLVTALVTPAIAVTGMTAKAGVDIFNSLPEYLEINQLATKNTIYGLGEAGEPVPIAQLYKQNREEVEWDQVSQYLKDAVVAGEDRRFYDHGGVDVASVARAAVGNLAANEIGSGASTLTMQLVKNIRIQAALEEPSEALQKAKLVEAQEQTIERKLQEMKLAIGLEKKYSKDEIMLAYLNIAGFGGTTYGVQSAAKQFFSVPASDVTLAQAASLIAVVQTPSSHSLLWEENFESNKKRRDVVILANMLELGYITQEQYDEAVATPIEVNYSEPQNGCMYASTAPFFCDYVTRIVPELDALGASPEERQANWDRGGYSIYTSLDIAQQNKAQEIVSAQAPAEESRMELGAVANVVEPGTGRIRVMAQNKYFDNSEAGAGPAATAVNFSTDRDYGGSSGFQTGSTYKIFTLAAWLNAGRGLNESVNGAKRPFNQASFPNSCEDTFTGTWTPPNYGGNSGSSSTTVLQSTINSYNISYVAMAQKLDLCDIRDTAEALGAHRADNLDLDYRPATVLGTNEMAPLTMAASIAAVGASGMFCKPTAIDNIVAADGTELGGQARECSQAVSPEVAAGMAYALKRVVTGGTATASNPRDGIDVAGKTGTTDNSEDTWMIGTTTKNAIAVWVGNINGKTNMNRISLAGGNGAQARHRIFRPVMQSLNAVYGGDRFAEPPGSLLSGRGAVVPNVIGQTQDQAKQLIESLGFNYAYGGEVNSSLEAGRVASVEPGAGNTVPQGSTVTVYGSLANAKSMPDVIGKSVAAAKTEIGGGYTIAENCQVLPPGTSPDNGAVGSVTASDPAAGTEIFPGGTITLSVTRLKCS